MCNLDKIAACQSELPLPEPYNKMWFDINKVIDGLHLRNHKGEDCQTKYHPKKIAETHPELDGTSNTMAAEQTFVWLGRFKKVLSSMPKVHHMFFLHRMVQRRNEYNIRCYHRGKKPLLPKLRNEHSS